MTLPEVLTMMFIAGLAIAFVRLMAVLSRLRTYIDAALDAELAAGERPTDEQATASPHARPGRTEACEICGHVVPHRVSVTVQGDDVYQQVWLCPACMYDDQLYEYRLARQQREEGRD